MSGRMRNACSSLIGGSDSPPLEFAADMTSDIFGSNKAHFGPVCGFDTVITDLEIVNKSSVSTFKVLLFILFNFTFASIRNSIRVQFP
jgi:hypothetical protein